MRLLLPLLLLAACSTDPAPTAPAAAPHGHDHDAAAAPHDHAGGDHDAEGHATGAHTHASPHGGEVKVLGANHVEAVFTPGGILFYVSDASQTALPASTFTGSAVVKGPAGVETIALTPMGDHLHAMAKLTHGQPATAVLTLTADGKAASAPFEVAAVGLTEHDHTALHGGQVGMWGDYHLEYAPDWGTHRVWVSDAKRVPVTTAVTGSLKDGDTVVPLTFDAATGMLSGAAEGAGTRPVMVDVKVGETSFSLGFNAAPPKPPAAHEHGGEHGHTH